MDDNNSSSGGGVWQRIKESPRTVSALIIILIVAAAIYAFSGEEATPPGIPTGGEAALTDEETEGIVEKEPQIAAETNESGQLAVLPEAKRTNEGYVEVAQAGDGYTHLARRATTRWLSENQASYAVTDEHRIYIEDYIQNRLGARGLELGESQTVSFDLVAEAVAAAGELNEQQLKNLSQYTGALK